MVTSVTVCTKEEQRAIILFLWAEGMPGAEIHYQVHG